MWTRLADVTKADVEALERGDESWAAALPERVLAALEGLRHRAEGAGEAPAGMPVDRLEHSLQTATRALRDGRADDYVVCALVHDLGDGLAPFNHAEFAACLVRPFVDDSLWWTVKHHAIFQGYYFFHHLGGDRHLRERYRQHPDFEPTRTFCERYDMPAFDPAYRSLALADFAPAVRRVFGRKPRWAQGGAGGMTATEMAGMAQA